MNSKDLAIGILSTTAVILLVGVLVIQSRPAPALAAGMATTAGRYGLSVGVASIDDEELLYLTDNMLKKMIIYRFNNSRATIDVLQGIDLEQMRKSTAGGSNAPVKKTKKKSRRRKP